MRAVDAVEKTRKENFLKIYQIIIKGVTLSDYALFLIMHCMNIIKLMYCSLPDSFAIRHALLSP
jgi:hypothetical protein